MKGFAKSAIAACVVTLSSQAALAAHVCGAYEVNVRNSYGDVFSSAYEGELISRTGQRRAFYLGYYEGRRTFERVYFHSHPRGYGWISSEFICGY